MANLISPLQSLWQIMKNKYKLDYILKCQNFTLGKFHGSWFHSLYLLKSWFHVHSGNDQKMQISDGKMNNAIAFVATRGVKNI